MAPSTRALPAKASLLLALSALTRYASALDVSICASFNTASGATNTSHLQSNGLCSDFCRSSYVFAITSHESCWCSNYQPAQDDTVSTSQCDFPCPGYPFEYCGGSDNLYGYLSLGPQPSGTKGSNDGGLSSSSPTSSSPASSTPASSSSSSPASSSTTTPESITTKSPSTTTTSTTTTSTTSTTTIITPSSSSTSETQSSSTSSLTKAASSSVQTVTVGGKVTVTTIIVTPTSTGDSTGDSSQDNKPIPTSSSRGLGGGAIAGIVIGALAGIALIGLLVFFLLRRRKQDDDEFREEPSIRGSSRGKIGSRQHDLSIAGSAASPGSAGNRSSMLQVDPRMDPFKQGLYNRNGSAESVNTLGDEHDYTRRIQQPKVLRATNPDPDT